MIYIVRHGETELNAVRTVQPAGTPLNQRGKSQAEAVGKRLGVMVKNPLLLSSDLQRCVDTSAALSQSLNREPIYSSLLQERNFGDIRGTPYDQLTANIFAYEYKPPNGEDGKMFEERVTQAWNFILQHAALHKDGDVVVVTHGLWIKVCCELFLKLPEGVTEVPASWGNTCVTVCSPSSGLISILNCTKHLDANTKNENDHKMLSGL